MLLFALVTGASAADLHFQVQTTDGVSESATWRSSETFNRRYGPVTTKKKASAVYTVSVTPSVFDPLKAGYIVEFTVCVEWSKKGKSDRMCDRQIMLAPAEANPSKLDVAVKGKESFDWSVSLWHTGETPPTGLPQSPPETEEE